MTQVQPKPAPASADRPFGVDPARPRWPLMSLSILYVIWLLVLLWMALGQAGRR